MSYLHLPGHHSLHGCFLTLKVHYFAFRYEQGWNKKLSYIVACSNEEIVDVTRRYTRKFDDVCTRRTNTPEAFLALGLYQLNSQLKVPPIHPACPVLHDRQVGGKGWRGTGQTGVAESRSRIGGCQEQNEEQGQLHAPRSSGCSFTTRVISADTSNCGA